MYLISKRVHYTISSPRQQPVATKQFPPQGELRIAKTPHMVPAGIPSGKGRIDALFSIWKNRREVETDEKVQETADSTRRQFYTDFGWEGSNHDWNRSLKEIAQIVRAYVKEKYPTYKFSVRTSYASMCQELHVALKEAPTNIYKKSPSELMEDERTNMLRRLRYNHLFQTVIELIQTLFAYLKGKLVLLLYRSHKCFCCAYRQQIAL